MKQQLFRSSLLKGCIGLVAGFWFAGANAQPPLDPADKLILGTTPVASVTATPAPAKATSSSIVKTDGTRAAEAWFNPNRPAWIDLYDAKCDSHPVYVEYIIDPPVDGSSPDPIRKDNNGGCGTTLRIPLTGFNCRACDRHRNFVIQYRVSVNIQRG